MRGRGLSSRPGALAIVVMAGLSLFSAAVAAQETSRMAEPVVAFTPARDTRLEWVRPKGSLDVSSCMAALTADAMEAMVLTLQIPGRHAEERGRQVFVTASLGSWLYVVENRGGSAWQRRVSRCAEGGLLNEVSSIPGPSRLFRPPHQMVDIPEDRRPQRVPPRECNVMLGRAAGQDSRQTAATPVSARRSQPEMVILKDMVFGTGEEGIRMLARYQHVGKGWVTSDLRCEGGMLTRLMQKSMPLARGKLHVL